MKPDELIPELKETIEELNADYGQEVPIPKSLDKFGFHFEFGSVFGLAYWHGQPGTGEVNSRVILLGEDDEFWFIREDTIAQFHPAWLSDMANVANRMKKYIKEKYSEELTFN